MVKCTDFNQSFKGHEKCTRFGRDVSKLIRYMYDFRALGGEMIDYSDDLVMSLCLCATSKITVG